MTTLWHRLRGQIGDMAMVAVGLIGLGVLLLAFVVQPQEARLAKLEQRAAHGMRHSPAEADMIRRGTPAAKLAGFYAYFEGTEGQVDLLAKLYGSARAAGLELRVADYRLIDTSGRLTRYEVTLPLAGTYVQLRDFLENALAEIPVLSLDQITLRRKRANEALLEADAVFTLHLLKP